jgi:hypothetical protein
MGLMPEVQHGSSIHGRGRVMGLFKPAWQSKNKRKALNAVANETDLEKLKEIIEKTSFDDDVHIAAARKISEAIMGETDPMRLAHIAKNAPMWIKSEVERKLSDMCEHDWSGVKCTRCGKERDIKDIGDQTILAAIAIGNECANVRIEAVERIEDQSLLIDMAKSSCYTDVRKIAVRKITDQSVLTYIAKTETDQNLRNHICAILTNYEHQVVGCRCVLCGSERHQFKVVNESKFTEEFSNGYEITTVSKVKCVKCGFVTEKKSVANHRYDPDYWR